MGTSDGRPGWQAEACPPWCVVLHEADDPQEDRRHVSASVPVAVVQRALGRDEPPPLLGGTADPDDPEGPRLVDLAVCLQRRDGAATTWLYVGDGERQALELCVDSWARLLPAVTRALALVRA